MAAGVAEVSTPQLGLHGSADSVVASSSLDVVPETCSVGLLEAVGTKSPESGFVFFGLGATMLEDGRFSSVPTHPAE